MNIYEYRLQTIREAIHILQQKEEYHDIVQELQREQQQILNTLERSVKK